MNHLRRRLGQPYKLHLNAFCRFILNFGFLYFYIIKLLILGKFIYSKKFGLMQLNFTDCYDTPEFIKGIIFNRAQQGASHRVIVQEIRDIGFSINQSTVTRILKQLK